MAAAFNDSDVEASDDENAPVKSADDERIASGKHAGRSDVARGINPTSESAVLQLQLQGMLDAAASDYDVLATKLDAVIRDLKRTLQKLPVGRIDGEKHGWALEAFNLPSTFHMPFHPPEGFAATGAFCFQCLHSKGEHVDVSFQIPDDCILDKDHLNHRYLGKRMLYLLTLASALNASRSFSELSVSTFLGDVRRPVLSATHVSSGLPFNLVPRVSAHVFKLSKLAPDRNCLRSATVSMARGVKRPAAGPPAAPARKAVAAGPARAVESRTAAEPARAGAAAASKDGAAESARSLAATPLYNASVLSDVLWHAHCADVARVLDTMQLRDVGLLLRLWAECWLPQSAHNALLLHVLWTSLACCVETSAVTRVMPPLQAFRSVLTFVADSAGWKRGRAMPSRGDPGQALPHGPGVPAHAATTPLVLLDASGWLNLLAGVPTSLWDFTKRVAKHTLAMLASVPAQSGVLFRHLFPSLDGAEAACAFDAEAVVTLGEQQLAGGLAGGDLPPAVAAAVKAERLLTRALTERAALTLVAPLLPEPVPYHLVGTRGLPGLSDAQRLRVGLLLDDKQASRILDRGPAADAAGAASFRQLWGERSQMRRFPDGGINEAVAWDHLAPADRPFIPNHIVTHILERHLPGAHVSGLAGRLAPALREKGVEPSASLAAMRDLDAAVASLSKRLRELDGITLRVMSCQLVCPAGRHTAAFPPLPHPLLGGGAAAPPSAPVARCLEPVELLVTLEGSGKWPDDAAAFAKTKAAFGCELAAALATTFQLESRASEQHLDVFVDGFVLRVLLWSDRDEALVVRTKRGLALSGDARKNLVSPAGVAGIRTMARVQHHGLMAFVTGEHPAAVGTCRLALRWLGGQLLSHHVSVEVAELLVASVYSRSAQAPPGSSEAGFLRFLRLLAAHEWASQPMIVDPAASLTDEQVKAALRRYRTRRGAGAAPACCLITPYDVEGERWSSERPSAEVMTRAARLAATSLAAVAAANDDAGAALETSGVWQSVFTCDLAAFDALVLLRHEALPNDKQRLHPSALERWASTMSPRTSATSPAIARPSELASSQRVVLSHIPKSVVKSLSCKALKKELLIGFDPLEGLISRLDASLGHLAIFCCDAHGGDVIGVKWRPAAFLPAPFRVAVAHTSMPLASAAPGVCIPNMFAILEDIYSIGDGMIADVFLQT